MPDEELGKREEIILALLNDPTYEKRYDKNHLLVLFKMFKFEPGIVYLCDKMNLREELLNYYIEKGKDESILALCKEYGQTEVNLWVQALKYFAKPSTAKKENTIILKKVPEVPIVERALREVKNIDALSPLLVLNILSKNGNVNLKLVKEYFRQKLEENIGDSRHSNKVVKENYEKAEKNRQDYKTIMTQGKTFRNEYCDSDRCGMRLQSDEATVYFMCGHAFHERCLHDSQEAGHFECIRCVENNVILQRRDDFKTSGIESTQFMEKLEVASKKFDVVAEFFGRGIFSNPVKTNEKR